MRNERVARDDVGAYAVSTMLLRDVGLYETMVFKGKQTDLACQRCATLDDARLQHAAMVARVQQWESAQ